MMYTLYLEHHGIKGQKWGRRRWQRSDGSLTPAGYDHYGVGKAQNAYDEAVSNLKKVRKTRNVSELYKASNEVDFRRRELSDTKTYASFKNQAKVSKRQQKFIDSYKNRGLTQKEAEIAAYKRARAEKIALAALGTAAAAAATYGAYKYADYAFDKKLTTKTVLSRVTKDLNEGGTRGVFDAFYAVNDRSGHDKARYAGLYAQQMRQGVYGYIAPQVYEKKIGVNSSIKVASQKHAKEVLAKAILNNSEGLSTFKAEFARPFNSPALSADIDKFVKTGKMSNRLYEHVNRSLVNRNLETTKTFYKALKDAGYGAVKDVNDSKYSGFRTRLPLIIFDSSKVSVKQVNTLSDNDINRKAARVFAENMANSTLKSIAPDAMLYSGIIAGSVGLSSYVTSKSESTIVSDYRKQHPNSNLSKNEIIRNYYNEQR